jgi:nucleotide-binding universal stress UspA family protein
MAKTRNEGFYTMEGSEPNSEITFDHVLFATDFSPASDAAFTYAATIADRYHPKLYVAHVINLEPFDLIAAESTPSMIKQAHEQARQKIERMLVTRGLQADRYEIIVAEGVVSDALIDILRRNRIDLAVLGTHGRRAFKKLLLGSIAEEVFRTAPCPVLTIGPKTASVVSKAEVRHVLYPLEFAPDSGGAAKYAVSLAERYGAKLTIMNVREDMPSSTNKQENFTEPVESWIEDHISEGSNLRGHVRFERGFGPVTEAILDFASKTAVDVIVISVRRVDPAMAAHLPKQDTAYTLVSGAPCPVLTIR